MSAGATPTRQATGELVTFYQALSQQWIHAQQVRWTLLYNFLIAGTILAGAAAALLASQNQHTWIVRSLCLIGLGKCVVWMGLSQRGNAFAHFYEIEARKLEDEFAPHLRPFRSSDTVREYLQFPASIQARHVFVFFPMFFGLIYLAFLFGTVVK